jgi:transposase
MTLPTNEHRAEDHSADVSEYRALVAELRAQNAALVARVAELERQLGLNSGNSGKPPSSDGLKKKAVRLASLRERTGKKPGGQKGHPGKTLSRTETPDATVNHFPKVCADCEACPRA